MLCKCPLCHGRYDDTKIEHYCRPKPQTLVSENRWFPKFKACIAKRLGFLSPNRLHQTQAIEQTECLRCGEILQHTCKPLAPSLNFIKCLSCSEIYFKGQSHTCKILPKYNLSCPKCFQPYIGKTHICTPKVLKLNKRTCLGCGKTYFEGLPHTC